MSVRRDPLGIVKLPHMSGGDDARRHGDLAIPENVDIMG